MNKILLWISLLVLCMAAVSASNHTNTSEYLTFDKIDIKVTDKINNNDDKADEGDSKFDVYPNAEIEIEIKVKSLYDDKNESEEDIEITDIEYEIIIEGIDDGDDIEEDGEIDDLKAGDKEGDTITFDLPLKIAEGDYDMVIIVTAEDDNNNDIEIRKEYVVSVDKEKHFLYMERFDLEPNTISCDQSAELRFSVVNLGKSDEDDTLFRISSAPLGINYVQEEDLEEGGEDDDVDFKDTVIISATGVKPGTYPVKLDVEYDDGDKTLSQTATLKVAVCSQDEVSDTTTTVVQPTNPTTTTTVTQPVTQPTTTVNAPATPVVIEYNEVPPSSGVFASTQSESWLEENSTVVLIIVAVFALALLAVALRK